MITVYTSNACPKCRILKSKLDALGIPYEESQDYGQMQGLMSLPAVRQDNGTMLTFEYAMLWLGLIERGEN